MTGTAGRRIASLVALTTWLMPHSGSAGGSIAPPFEDARAGRTCSISGGSYTSPEPPIDCTAVATAASSGDFTVDLDVASPLGGMVPGASAARGYADFFAPFTLARPANSLTFSLTAHIDNAEASKIGSAPDPGPPDFDAYAELSLEVSYGECPYCDSAYVGVPLVDSQGYYAPASVTDQDLSFEVTIEGSDNHPIPVGQVGVFANVWSAATVGSPLPDAGEAHVSVTATITGITVRRR